MGNFVGIDIGGTAMKYGLLDDTGAFLSRGQYPTNALQGGSAIVRRAFELIRTYQPCGQIEGVCISTAGMVDCLKGEIFFAGPQIPDYIGVNWKQRIWDEFALPCEVENDVNCAGLSEALLGAGRGAASCLCLTVGTGIGGCAVMDGRVLHGFSGSACEIGYLHLSEGVFQDIASTTALVQRVAARRGETLDGKQIFDLADAGDTVCRAEIESLCARLAQGIANCCYVLNPEVVVLGGGIMARRDVLAPLLETALSRELIPAVRAHTRLAFAENGNWAGILGAFQHYKNMRGME